MFNLGRDYMPVAKLYRSDKPGAASAELVVMRRGSDEALQGQVQQALLEMAAFPGARRSRNPGRPIRATMVERTKQSSLP